MKIKVYTIKLNPPRWLRNVIVYVALPIGALLGAAVAVRAGANLTTFTAKSPIKAAEVNANFTALNTAVTTLQGQVPGLVKPTPFFNWSLVTAAASSVEAVPPEGIQTLTFSVAGYYRVTLNAQSIHDNGTSCQLTWYLGGTAKRLDPFSQEAGGKNILIMQGTDGRAVESTVLFLSATAGQTLTVKPSLIVTYPNGNYHQATFMYAAEYLGPP